jgi:hypothetical protein
MILFGGKLVMRPFSWLIIICLSVDGLEYSHQCLVFGKSMYEGRYMGRILINCSWGLVVSSSAQGWMDAWLCVVVAAAVLVVECCVVSVRVV